jgi:hypothetical protein
MSDWCDEKWANDGANGEHVFYAGNLDKTREILGACRSDRGSSGPDLSALQTCILHRPQLMTLRNFAS